MLVAAVISACLDLTGGDLSRGGISFVGFVRGGCWSAGSRFRVGCNVICSGGAKGSRVRRELSST